MDRCSAAAIIFEPGYGGDAASTDFVEVAKALPKLRRLYALPKAGDTVPVGASAYPATGSARSTTPPVTNPDKICYLAFTSGTTGQPKGVMHSDNTLLANGRAMVRDWNLKNANILYSDRKNGG